MQGGGHPLGNLLLLSDLTMPWPEGKWPIVPPESSDLRGVLLSADGRVAVRHRGLRHAYNISKS